MLSCPVAVSVNNNHNKSRKSNAKRSHSSKQSNNHVSYRCFPKGANNELVLEATEARNVSGTTANILTPGGLYVSVMEKEWERQQQEEAALRAKRRAEEEPAAAEEARKHSKSAPAPQNAGTITRFEREPYAQQTAEA